MPCRKYAEKAERSKPSLCLDSPLKQSDIPSYLSICPPSHAPSLRSGIHKTEKLPETRGQTGILDGAAICRLPDSPPQLVPTLSEHAADYSSQPIGIHAHHSDNDLGSAGHSLRSGPSPVSLFTQGTLEHA